MLKGSLYLTGTPIPEDNAFEAARNMRTDEIIRNRAIASKLLLFETFVVALVGFILFLFNSFQYAYSLVLGGFAYILPNTIFMMLSFRDLEASSDNVLIWFYIGEAVKIIFTIVFFALSFLLVEKLNIVIMVIVYGLVLFANLVGLSIFINNK